jgi:hypothetical protein
MLYRIAHYIVQYESPIKTMQDEFRTVNNAIGKALLNIYPTYAKLRTVTMMRKDSALNITLKPEDMAKPLTEKVIGPHFIPY